MQIPHYTLGIFWLVSNWAFAVAQLRVCLLCRRQVGELVTVERHRQALRSAANLAGWAALSHFLIGPMGLLHEFAKYEFFLRLLCLPFVVVMAASSIRAVREFRSGVEFMGDISRQLEARIEEAQSEFE